jgi:hypothetical protein
MKFYDDDMDELFNKAGREYPLKTDPKNWEAVRSALHHENGAEEVTQKRNGWKRLLPLLFLLMIPAVYVFVDKNNINSQQSVKADASQVTKKEIATTKSNNNENNTSTENLDNNNNNNNNNNKTSLDNTRALDGDRRRDNTIALDNDNNKRLENDNKRLGNNARLQYNDYDNYNKNLVKSSESNSVHNNSFSERIDDKPGLWNNIPSLNTAFIAANEPSELISLQTPLRSLNQTSGSTSVPNLDKKTKYRKGPYAGLMAAPDLSTIKGQHVSGIGYSAGAIVGYTLNNRWQIEGGVLWSRKKYYTDGKYFNKEGAGVPDYVNVLWLDGGCEMLEFPIVARYNFSQKKNTFFGSAGLTSYLMEKEDYDYKALAGASGTSYEGYREYDRSGDHLFANLQLSAGYNFSLSSKLNIRIEPYLKAPLKKIGIGKMPVTSTGLYFAITRDFR